MPKFARRRRRAKSDYTACLTSNEREIAISRPNNRSGTFAGLKQAFSNQALQRMLKAGIVQARLAVNRPGDRYELEAERVADQVMRMAEPSPQLREDESEKIQKIPLAEKITPLMQRQTEPEEEEEEEKVQTKQAEGGSPDLSPNLDAEVRSLKGRGDPLPGSVRDFFEPRFGCDFSNVRVHTDHEAAATARALNARAFTAGRDVVLGSGRPSMQTEEGKRLLAHELTHVVQQAGGRSRPVQVSRCGQSVQRRITVHPASSTVSGIDTSRTSREIGTLAAGGGVAYGLTHHHIPAMIGVPDTVPRMRGQSYHVAVWRAEAFPRVENTIYIASDLAAESCPFRSTLDHEAGHVLDAYAIMVRHREHLVSDLGGLPGPESPVEAASVREAREAREDIRNRMTRIERCVMSQACYDMYRTDWARDAREYPGIFDGCPPPRPPVPRAPARGLVNVLCRPPPDECPRPVVPFP